MAYQTLYRSYRPQGFEEVVGQDAILQTLKNSISLKRIPHALLFSGPRGTGKTSLARIFAKALNCRKGPIPSPCQTCDLCVAITKGTAVDVIEMDAASNRGIDEIRELSSRIRFMPVEGTYKIYIVDEVHMLTSEAFNALLKTLEEPPPHAIFILATTEIQKVPVTILSRCQRFDFRRLAHADIIAQLQRIATQEKLTIEAEAYALIAQHADGALRDAISLLDQLITYCDQTIRGSDVLKLLATADLTTLFQMGTYVAGGDIAGILQAIQQMEAAGNSLVKVTRDLIDHFRNLLLAKLSPPLVIGTKELQTSYGQAAEHFSLETLQHILQELTQMEGNLKWVGNPKALLEITLIGATTAPLPNRSHTTITNRQEQHTPSSSEKENISPTTAADFSAPPIAQGLDPSVLLSKWGEFLAQLQAESPEAFALVEPATPTDLTEETLFLQYNKGFSFHAMKLQESSLQASLRDIFLRNFGKKVTFAAMTDGARTPPPQPTNSENSVAIAEIAALFEGRLVS